MLDIKIIRDNPEDVKARLKAKEVDCDAAVDRILELDAERREAFVRSIEDEVQTVITTTNLGYFSDAILSRARVVTIEKDAAMH